MGIEEIKALRKDRAEAGLQPFSPAWDGVVVAFDQSLAKTGMCMMHVVDDDLVIVFTKMMKTEADYSGHEGNLRRAEEQYQNYLAYLSDRAPDLVVHETPPVSQGMSRPESSLLAAREVRRACIELDIPYAMIGAQTAKKRITGNGNAKKRELRDGVRELVPMLSTVRPNNEDTCDAAALAVVAFESEEYKP